MTKIRSVVASDHIRLNKTYVMLSKNKNMDLATKRTTIRTSLDTLVCQLSDAFTKTGFIVCGMNDFQKEHYDALKIHHNKHKIIWVDYPAISAEMLSQHVGDCVILPCSVSVVELFPGDVSVIITNPTEILASISGNTRLSNLARRVTSLIENVVKDYEKDSSATPDLVTSWE